MKISCVRWTNKLWYSMYHTNDFMLSITFFRIFGTCFISFYTWISITKLLKYFSEIFVAGCVRFVYKASVGSEQWRLIREFFVSRICGAVPALRCLDLLWFQQIGPHCLFCFPGSRSVQPVAWVIRNSWCMVECNWDHKRMELLNVPSCKLSTVHNVQPIKIVWYH